MGCKAWDKRMNISWQQILIAILGLLILLGGSYLCRTLPIDF